MKAAVLRAQNQPMEIESSRFLGPREVLVRTLAAEFVTATCLLDGSYPYQLPTILGHERRRRPSRWARRNLCEKVITSSLVCPHSADTMFAYWLPVALCKP